MAHEGMYWSGEVIRDLPRSTRIEWLETNGLGGYAMTTIVGMNTRRYHGLLVAALRPPGDRHVFLSKLEETLDLEGRSFELSCNRYPGVIHPEGYRYQESFSLAPFPTFSYRAGEARIEKRLVLLHEKNTLVVRYRVRHATSFRLRVRPLLAFRGYHVLTAENGAFNGEVRPIEGGISFRPYPSLPRLSLFVFGGCFREEPYWVKHMEYPEETARGLEDREDLYSPGEVIWSGCGRGTYYLLATLEDGGPAEAAALLGEERRRGRDIERRTRWMKEDEATSRLLKASGAFLVRGMGSRKTVIAGYPWFTDWGRDTMISLPGLALVPRRFEAAREILLGFSKLIDRGLIPNYIADDGRTAEYQAADASLRLIHAVEEYRRASGDHELIKTLYPALTEVVKWHIRGTRFGICMDPVDHLLSIGTAGLALTWMDAKIDGRPVTPRAGKPVDVNALWYRALTLMAWWTGHLGCRVNPYTDLAHSVRDNFDRLFWCEKGGYLYDVIGGEEGNDESLRPNQLFALGLADDLVTKDHARSVLGRVREELLTPYGLRSLSPKDPRYRGTYSGNPVSRDGSYHQGTVWPWLLGIYADAVFHVEGDSPRTRAHVRGLLEPFRAHLRTGGAGTVSEIFDGDPPHQPRGCPAQAWSVGELLRLSIMARHGSEVGGYVAP